MALSLYVPQRRPADRNKLGLALAGGGFRASLFHLGVLWRMAETDLLRYVEVLSTVSGGSIIGALYALLLKRQLEQRASLSRDDYVTIVARLHDIFVTAIRKDLRTRLFMNPFGILRVLLTQHSLGMRMARIYEYHLYREAAAELRRPSAWQRLWRPGRFPLREMLVMPGGKKIQGGIEAYNAAAVRAHRSAVTHLILNATSLNSGAPFRFSCTEIGDPRLGYFRYDEIGELTTRKRLVHEFGATRLNVALASGADPVTIDGASFSRRVVALALGLLSGNFSAARQAWPLVFGRPGFPGCLLTTSFGLLRQAKLAAWYVRLGPTMQPPVTGSLDRESYLRRFWQVMREIDETLAGMITQALGDFPGLLNEALDFVIELYYLRSAEVVSPRIKPDWNDLTLARAVAASANFPPVFTPMIFLGFYDDLHVTRLGLTDGGVYDNVGIATLLEEGCTHIIASDTGGIFDIQKRVSTGWVGMLARIASVLMDDVAEQQRAALRERRRVSAAIASVRSAVFHSIDRLRQVYRLDQLAFFQVDSADPPPALGPALQINREAVARLRTDLDAFGDVEVAALVNNGYDRADKFLHRYFTDPAYTANPCWTTPPNFPRPVGNNPARVERILTVGAHRFFRALYLGSVPSWAFTLAVLAALIGLTWRVPFSVRSAICAVAEWLIGRLATPIPHLLQWPFNRFTQWLAPFNRFTQWLVSATFPLGLVIAVLLAAGLVVFLAWPRLIAWARRRWPRATRAAVTFFKYVRAGALNVLWLAGLLPIWIALASCLIGWTNYLAYTKPFLRKTRI